MTTDNLLNDLLDDPEAQQEISTTSFDEEDLILAPLLEEIGRIQDEAIRLFVRSVLLRAEEFWTSPAAPVDSHPPDENKEGGNVLHTKRVFRIVSLICEAQDRTAFETDLLYAAALIHDITKYIAGIDGEIHYDPIHPYTVDQIVQGAMLEDSKHANDSNRSTTLHLNDEGIAQIMRLVRCHLGLWSPIPETYPLTALDWNLHLADYLATKLHVIIDGPDFDKRRWSLNESDVPEKKASNRKAAPDLEGS